MPAATDDDDSDPAAMLEELKASHQFFLVGRSAWQELWQGATWETGDVVFSCPLQLRMARVPVYFGEGGEGWIEDGIILATDQLEAPAVFHPAAGGQAGGAFEMDLAIYAKSSDDHRVAHMLTLPGCALLHEDEHLLRVSEGSRSACALKQRETPAWTRCITHADRSAGPSDDFEVDIPFDGELDFDDGARIARIACTRMQFHLHRNAFLARDGDFMTLGEPVACRARLPLCVRDMPAILETLVWA